MDRFAGDHAGRLDDLFTETERAYETPDASACTWALKESALKAIGGLTGWEADWTEIEVTALQPAPTVVVHGRVAELARAAHITELLASLSRTPDYVLATVVAVDTT